MSGAESVYQGRDIANGVLGGALNGLAAGEQRASSALTAGSNQAAGLLGQAGAVYDPLVQGGGAAFGRLLDATGANGAEGSDRATAAFRAAPGYEFARDEALGAVARAGGARGDLAGGNVTADLLRTATGYGDQAFQQYVNNLSGLTGAYTTGLSGQAGALTGQAGLAATTGSGLADIATRAEQNRTGVLGQIAQNDYGAGATVAGAGNAAAGNIAQTLMAGAKQQEAASANALGGISSLLGSIGSFAGGNGISNLTNLFK